MSDETDRGDHDAHAKGLAALMQIESSPRNLLGKVRSHNKSSRNNNLQNNKVPPIGNSYFNSKQILTNCPRSLAFFLSLLWEITARASTI